MPRKSPGERCCVVGCFNTSLNAPGTKFYCFPARSHKLEQKQKWIKAVNRKNENGVLWEPSKRSRLCSRHFVNNAKSEHPLSPSFVPTIFPSLYYCNKAPPPSERSLENKHNRFTRAMRREDLNGNKVQAAHREVNNVGNEAIESQCSQEPKYQDVAVQHGFWDSTFQNRTLYKPTVNAVDTNVAVKMLQTCDKKVAVEPGFHGFDSVKVEHNLVDLAGISFRTFDLLLKILNDTNETRISKENRLLCLVFKIKLGLTYSSIGVLFGVHRTTISRNFHATLENLAETRRNFISEPSTGTLLSTMPQQFKDCRVIIDCKECARRVHFYSHYKNCSTVQILVGCTPKGAISLESKCFGGRRTDVQVITTQSGLLNFLANKGRFPGVTYKYQLRKLEKALSSLCHRISEFKHIT